MSEKNPSPEKDPDPVPLQAEPAQSCASLLRDGCWPRGMKARAPGWLHPHVVRDDRDLETLSPNSTGSFYRSY